MVHQKSNPGISKHHISDSASTLKSLERKAFVTSFPTHGRLEEAIYESYRKGKLSRFTLSALLSCEGVRRTPRGILIDTTILDPDVVKALEAISSLVVPPSVITQMASERMHVIKQLKELGYRVIILDFGITSHELLDRAKQYAKIFHSNPPIVGYIKGLKEYHQSINWLRDLWNNVAGKRIMRLQDELKMQQARAAALCK